MWDILGAMAEVTQNTSPSAILWQERGLDSRALHLPCVHVYAHMSVYARRFIDS